MSGLPASAHTTAFVILHSRPVALPISSVCFSQFTVARLNIGCLLSSASPAILNVPVAYIPYSFTRNPLSSYEPNDTTFEQELAAQAIPAHPNSPSKLPIIASRINIARASLGEPEVHLSGPRDKSLEKSECLSIDGGARFPPCPSRVRPLILAWARLKTAREQVTARACVRDYSRAREGHRGASSWGTQRDRAGSLRVLTFAEQHATNQSTDGD